MGEVDLDYPRYFMIETVRACNSRCPFCFLSTVAGMPTGVMTDQLYNTIERDLLEHAEKITRITLHGFGEPLLDKRIGERISRLKQAGIPETMLASNAALLDEDMARGLLESGLDMVKLSISSIIPEKYRTLRVGLDLETVMANAHRYFALRNEIRPASRIDISMELHPCLSEDDVAAWKKHWEPYLAPGDRLVVSELYDLSDGYDRRELVRGEDEEACEALMQTMVIGFDGVAHLCCRDFYDGKARFPVGNANAMKIEDIWRGKAFTTFRAWHRTGQRRKISICDGCTLWSAGTRQHFVKACARRS